MIALVFILWLIGMAKTVIEDNELALDMGFRDWTFIFILAFFWPIVDAVFVFNVIRKGL